MARRAGEFTLHLADGVGFEPTKRLAPLPDFKSGAFDRSATHPFFVISDLRHAPVRPV